MHLFSEIFASFFGCENSGKISAGNFGSDLLRKLCFWERGSSSSKN